MRRGSEGGELHVQLSGKIGSLTDTPGLGCDGLSCHVCHQINCFLLGYPPHAPSCAESPTCLLGRAV